MGIPAAKLPGPLIHQIHKGAHASADVFADGVAHLIGGAYEQAV